MKLRLRTLFILEFLLPIVLVGLISMFVGTGMIRHNLSLQAQHNLQLDINSARLIYQHVLDGILEPLRLATFDPTIRNALGGGALEQARAHLESLGEQGSLDILSLLDSEGKIVVGLRAPPRSQDSLAADPVIQAIIGGRELVTSTEIADQQELRRESEALVERARIPIVAASSGPEAEREEDCGMLQKAAVAVKDEKERLIGILYGARLLNRDETIVDEMYQTIFKGETYKGRQVGEATLCLGDLRISTVVTEDGQRAVGTRIAADIRDHVLLQGQPWVGRSSVVGDWHLAAYEPIKDMSGHNVGVLALGILEKKLTDVRTETLVVFSVIVLSGVFLAFILVSLMARNVGVPTRKLLQAMEEVAGGNLDYQADIQSDIYEMAELGRHVNQMSHALKERDLVIKRQTEEKISRSERLAIIGRLAAGVAHQINNPLGGIMLFSNLLLDKAPKEGIERENLERIAGEARRCQKIVQGLLDFSRYREPKLEKADIRTIIDKTLQLVENQSMFLDVVIERHYGEAPAIQVDVAQMQEVFLNLILNAVEAMDGRGVLRVTVDTADEGRSVCISFVDTGCGIAEDQIERIFEPFFTTKEAGKGTGLGLSVSRGTVESHGGRIWATSVPGKGATFFVSLPAGNEESSPEGGS
ncbi:MAG: cache domain-containing protein [Rectinema sp.]